MPFHSPAFCTTRPLADLVSAAGAPGRLIVIETHEPLYPDPAEIAFVVNAVVRVVGKGSFVALHAPGNDLTTGKRHVQTLVDQVYSIWNKVVNGRGEHAEHIRVYHCPRPAGQQKLFDGPRRIGWDVITVDHTRNRDPDTIRGVAMRRNTWADAMAKNFRSSLVPENSAEFELYDRMIRSLTSVTSRRFPLASSWRPCDRIAEIDPSTIT